MRPIQTLALLAAIILATRLGAEPVSLVPPSPPAAPQLSPAQPTPAAVPTPHPATLLPTYRLVPAPPGAHPGSLLAPALRAIPTPVDPLDAPVKLYRVVKTPIEVAFQSVSRTYGITFILDPALKGDVTLDLRDGTVRDLLDALTQSQGFYWERDGRLIAVRKNVVRFYPIDYPQMTRSAQGSSNVVLSGQPSGNSGYGNNGSSSGASTGTLNAGNPSLNNGTSGANQNDQTNISIQQQNQTTFWSDVQSELSGLALSVKRWRSTNWPGSPS